MSDKFAGRFKVNYRLLLVAILLLATILRIYGLNNLSPPGLAHDEVAHWLINQDILAGNHAVYFTEAYGHEAGFHYVQTLFMVLLGDNTLALRLPSAFAGVLLVAVSFTLARRLFGLETALLSSSLLAVLFWPVFYSRLALRAISLPLLSGLSAVFWWSGWQSGSASSRPGFAWLQSPIAYFAVAGLLSGLSLYTYMAARVVPIFWALFILYLLLFQRPELKSCWRGVLLFFLSQLVVATPLILFLLTTPGAEYRISEVDAPLRALLGGNLEPVLDNSLKIVGMFGFRGDPLWRQNIAFLPVFAPVVSVFFYIGTLICLWLWRKPRYIFLILWLFTATIPSILTIDAPSSIRIVNALPIIGLLPAIGLQVIHIFKPFSTVSGKLSPEIGRIGIYLALMTLLLTCTVRTARGLFVTWPAEDKVQFVWQKALTEAAGYLDRQKTAGPVAIGGWTPETMDPPTMALTLWRDDLSLRYFDPGQTLILPVSPAGQSIRVIRPAILPLEPYLEALLVAWGAGPEAIDTFTLYQLPALPAIRPKYPQDVSFGKELTFLGYDQLTGCEPGNGACELITYWQVEMLDGGSRSIFLHLVDPAGTIIDQDDGLGAPAGHWQPGDIILQRHTLTIPAGDEVLSLRVGVYNPEDSRRLLAADGGDFVELLLYGVGAGG